MFLDVGFGLILGVILNSLSGFSYGWSLAIGVFASLSPDLDFWVAWLLSRKFPMDHRESSTALHYPLIFIPILTLIGILLDSWLGLIFFVGSFFHFIHDSVSVGWGVKWLYPFSKKEYSWGNQKFKDTYERGKHYSARTYVRQTYFTPNGYALVNYIVFVTGLCVAINNR